MIKRLTKEHEDLILDYLQQTPDFFVRHANTCQHFNVTHPVKGCISLVEWSLTRKRQQLQQFEQQLEVLKFCAENNEILFEQLLSLITCLIQQDTLQQALEQLNEWAKLLGLASADVRLFEQKWQILSPLDCHRLSIDRQQFEFIRLARFGYSKHYLGVLNSSEIAFLSPQTDYVGSVAMSLLGSYGDLGIIIFTSRETNHYQEGQGTLLLSYISHFLPMILMRWLPRV